MVSQKNFFLELLKKSLLFIMLAAINLGYSMDSSTLPSQVPFPIPPNILNVPNFNQYKQLLDIWVQSTEGQAFVKEVMQIPQNLPAYKQSNLQNKYNEWKQKREGEKSGASSKLGTTLAPVITKHLNISEKDLEGNASEVMNKVGKALEEQNKKAQQSIELEKNLIEEKKKQQQVQQLITETTKQKQLIEQQKTEADNKNAELEVMNAGMRGLLNPQDVVQLEKDIEAKLEGMREKNAMKNALDSLRLLTYYLHQQNASNEFGKPTQELDTLTKKSSILVELAKIREIIGKNALELPINKFDNIPFFAQYDSKFATSAEFKALQAWQVLQKSRLKKAQLTEIKSWANAKKRNDPSPQAKGDLEKQTKIIQDLFEVVQKDLLWQAFQKAHLIDHNHIYFWAQAATTLDKVTPLANLKLVNISKATEEYAAFRDQSSLEKYATSRNDNELLHLCFMISSIEKELGEGESAKNFALFGTLNEAYQDIEDTLKAYNSTVQPFFDSVSMGMMETYQLIQRLTKLPLDSPDSLKTNNLVGNVNTLFMGDLKTLESLYFCIDQENEKITQFNQANKNSCKNISEGAGALLQKLIPFINNLHDYNKRFYMPARAVEPANNGEIRLLTYKRADPVDIQQKSPSRLREGLDDLLQKSKPEKDQAKLDIEIEKLQKTVIKEVKMTGKEKNLASLILWIEKHPTRILFNKQNIKELKNLQEQDLYILNAFYEELSLNSDLVILIESDALLLNLANKSLDSQKLSSIIKKFKVKGDSSFTAPSGSVDIVELSAYLFSYGLDELKKLENSLRNKITPDKIQELLVGMYKELDTLKTKPDDKTSIKMWYKSQEYTLDKIKSINLTFDKSAAFALSKEKYDNTKINGFIQSLSEVLNSFINGQNEENNAQLEEEVEKLKQLIIAAEAFAEEKKNAGTAVVPEILKDLAAKRVFKTLMPQVFIEQKKKELTELEKKLAPSESAAQFDPKKMDELKDIIIKAEQYADGLAKNASPMLDPTLMMALMGKGILFLPMEDNNSKLQKLKLFIEGKKKELEALEKEAQQAKMQPTNTTLQIKLKSGEKVAIEEFMQALKTLHSILGSQIITTEGQIKLYGQQKQDLVTKIPVVRQCYLELLEGKAESERLEVSFQELTKFINPKLLQFFEKINCASYVNLETYSSDYINKLMMDFMASVEFVLWQKIDAFGTKYSEEIKQRNIKEISRQKEEFNETFLNETLKDLLSKKLIKLEEINNFTTAVISEISYKLQAYYQVLEPEYKKAVYEDAKENKFNLIMEKYVKDLVSTVKHANSIKSTNSLNNPFEAALKNLKKVNDSAFQKINSIIIKDLEDFEKFWKVLLNNQKEIKEMAKAALEAKTTMEKLYADVKAQRWSADFGNLAFSDAGGGSLFSLDTTFHVNFVKYKDLMSDTFYEFFDEVALRYINKIGVSLKDFVDKEAPEQARQEEKKRVRAQWGYNKIGVYTFDNIISMQENVMPIRLRKIRDYYQKQLNDPEKYREFIVQVLQELFDNFLSTLQEKIQEALDEKTQQISEKAIMKDSSSTGLQGQSELDVQQQSQDRSIALREMLSLTAEKFSVKYKELEDQKILTTVSAEDITAQQKLLLLQFMEEAGIININTVRGINANYKKLLEAIKTTPMSELIKGNLGGIILNSTTGNIINGLKRKAANSFEQKLAEDSAKQQLTDLRAATLLKFSVDAKKAIATSVKEIGSGNNSNTLLKKLAGLPSNDKTLATVVNPTKTNWLAERLEKLYASDLTTPSFNFSQILKEILDMQEKEFLDNFFWKETLN